MPIGSRPPSGWQSTARPPREPVGRFKLLFEKLDRIEDAVRAGVWKRQSEPPSTDAINNARTVLGELRTHALRPTGITPSAEGGLGIYFDRNQRYADVEILNSGKILGVVSDKSGGVNAFEVMPSLEGYKEALARIRDFLG